jgi:hypothetical protein
MSNTSTNSISKGLVKTEQFGETFDAAQRIAIRCNNSMRLGRFAMSLAAHLAAGVSFGPLKAKRSERLLIIGGGSWPEIYLNEACGVYGLTGGHVSYWQVPMPGWIENPVTLADAIANAKPTIIVITDDYYSHIIAEVIRLMPPTAKLIAITDTDISGATEFVFGRNTNSPDSGPRDGVAPDAFYFRHDASTSWWNADDHLARNFQFIRVTSRRGPRK